MALGQWIHSNLGEADLRHLYRVERWGRLSTVAGYALSWFAVNPISWLLISHGIMVRWTVGHQLNHGGYDDVPGLPPKYHSSRFARGFRRYIDWFDWMAPDAWELEHVQIHHFYTGETTDPDLIQRNLSGVRKSRAPKLLRYLAVAASVLTWKWTYYAPQTLMYLQNQVRGEKDFRQFTRLFDFRTSRGREFWRRCLLPFFSFRFVLVPLAFSTISRHAAACVLVNSIFAELVTNLESFCLIGPNHAAEDLRSFDDRAKGKSEFYLRQVLTTSNYTSSTELDSFLMGYLDVHLEHHLWPAAPMLKYRQVRPKLKELCNYYGFPYTEEPLLRRLKKTIDIMIGNTSMLRTGSAELEKRFSATAEGQPVVADVSQLT